MADSNSAAAVARSGFITALAWSFIILAAFATIITLFQNIMITLMFPMEEMRAAMREAQKSQPMPEFFVLVFNNFQLVFAAALASSVMTLVAAIGLLKRQNWARLLFIVIMAFGVAWNLAGLATPLYMNAFIPEIPGHAPPGIEDNFKLVLNILVGFTVVMCLVFAGLFAWVVKRLMSDDIKREFQPR
jgi:hypothetical protein